MQNIIFYAQVYACSPSLLKKNVTDFSWFRISMTLASLDHSYDGFHKRFCTVYIAKVKFQKEINREK